MRLSKRLISFFLPSLAILLQPSPVSSLCYYPNGTADDNYQPCNNVKGVNSMCCALDRPNASGGPDSKGWTADICLENGLCQNIVQRMSTGQMVYTYWRTLCTSTDWSTNGCLNVCTGGEVFIFLAEVLAAASINGYWLDLSGAYCPAHAVREYTRVEDLVLWAE
ncbi:uncharacterized protein CDV56_106262 [Aspergillus thermomutatus]|uniref:Uncharacterized protein n=1 Tax=Aspergillus thermomutatus TaxID=41047 RepID=A0A397GT85_ASPTH|nr:uncharacterized protein CDV56_106262 [Aspergillus thermomutatus]RHZ54242.1 hypothetical protein CDV56_106262 [Aspergillus thermomutatus]